MKKYALTILENPLMDLHSCDYCDDPAEVKVLLED